MAHSAPLPYLEAALDRRLAYQQTVAMFHVVLATLPADDAFAASSSYSPAPSALAALARPWSVEVFQQLLSLMTVFTIPSILQLLPAVLHPHLLCPVHHPAALLQLLDDLFRPRRLLLLIIS